MKSNYMLCVVAVAVFATPALAASEFYVVQNITTMKCSIADAKPVAAAMTILGTASYKTHAEAKTAMKAEGACASK